MWYVHPVRCIFSAVKLSKKLPIKFVSVPLWFALSSGLWVLVMSSGISEMKPN